MTVPAIDVVSTWVNGESPAYQDLYRRHARSAEDSNPERYRDTYALLKYSLRSLDRHAPWLRDVYLFTCRPQVPEWLAVDHRRVHVVHHDEVLDARYLPTFSCNAIESHLAAIPSASELHRTRERRFRHDADLRMERLYRYHLLAHRRARVEVVSVLHTLRVAAFHKITNQPARQRRLLERLRRRRPKFLCLNDDQRDRPNPAVVTLVRRFLDDLFPGKSPYER